MFSAKLAAFLRNLCLCVSSPRRHGRHVHLSGSHLRSCHVLGDLGQVDPRCPWCPWQGMCDSDQVDLQVDPSGSHGWRHGRLKGLECLWQTHSHSARSARSGASRRSHLCSLGPLGSLGSGLDREHLERLDRLDPCFGPFDLSERHLFHPLHLFAEHPEHPEHLCHPVFDHLLHDRSCRRPGALLAWLCRSLCLCLCVFGSAGCNLYRNL